MKQLKSSTLRGNWISFNFSWIRKELNQIPFLLLPSTELHSHGSASRGPSHAPDKIGLASSTLFSYLHGDGLVVHPSIKWRVGVKGYALIQLVFESIRIVGPTINRKVNLLATI